MSSNYAENFLKELPEILHENDPFVRSLFEGTGIPRSTYKKDTFTKTFFEKAFECKLTAAYTSSPSFPSKKELDWGSTSILLVFESGKVTILHNSEWAFISIVP